MKLHDDLGVSEDATPEEIKGAYKAQAKKLHPDNSETGNEEEFKKVQNAYMILSDPDKRKRYEETGKEDGTSQEDRELATALEMITNALRALLTEPGFDPARHDPLKAARRLVRQQRGKYNAELFEVGQTLETVKKTIKRVKKKDNKKGARVMALMAKMERDLTANVRHLESRVRSTELAMELLKECDYELDPANPKGVKITTVSSPEAAAMLKEFMGAAAKGGR